MEASLFESVVGEKFFVLSIRRSIVKDGFHHSFDFAYDLYFELALEYDVLWSDHLPVAITLQLETCQKCRVTFSDSIHGSCRN